MHKCSIDMWRPKHMQTSCGRLMRNSYSITPLIWSWGSDNQSANLGSGDDLASNHAHVIPQLKNRTFYICPLFTVSLVPFSGGHLNEAIRYHRSYWYCWCLADASQSAGSKELREAKLNIISRFHCAYYWGWSWGSSVGKNHVCATDMTSHHKGACNVREAIFVWNQIIFNGTTHFVSNLTFLYRMDIIITNKFMSIIVGTVTTKLAPYEPGGHATQQ